MQAQKIFVILCFGMCLLTEAKAQNDPVSEFRKELFYTDFNLEKGIAFYNKITATHLKTPTVVAYKAAAKALVAKYSWNPVTKINALKYAEELLTEAVNIDASNLEVRFLRFYIENNIPPYLGYSKNLNKDGDILVQNLSKIKELNIDQGIADYIFGYVSGLSGQVSHINTP